MQYMKDLSYNPMEGLPVSMPINVFRTSEKLTGALFAFQYVHFTKKALF